MWAAIASIILGALGWGFARLVFEPMKEIVDLRREAQECLIIHGNLAKDAPAEDRRAASDTLRPHRRRLRLPAHCRSSLVSLRAVVLYLVGLGHS